jgi:aminopeptidase N
MQTRAAFQRIPNSYGKARYAGTRVDFDFLQNVEDMQAVEKLFSDLHFVIQATNPALLTATVTKEAIWSWFEETWERVHSNGLGGLNQDAAFIREFASMLRENHFNYVEAVAQQEVTKAELEQCKARLRAMTHDLGLTDADMEAAIEAALAIPPEVQSGGSN